MFSATVGPSRPTAASGLSGGGKTGPHEAVRVTGSTDLIRGLVRGNPELN